jgi:hypothetical protein
MRLGFRLVKAGVCAFALLGAGVVLLALAPPNSEAAPGEQLLPDLVTQQFNEAYIEGGPGETLLRFSNTVANRGVGPLEVLSKRADAALCPDSGDRPAFQRVYRDSAVAGSAVSSAARTISTFAAGSRAASSTTQHTFTGTSRTSLATRCGP